MENTNKFYINGEWVEPSTSDTLEVINPATEEAIASIAMGGTADVDATQCDGFSYVEVTLTYVAGS